MSNFSESDALETYWRASPANRQLILAQARECLQARQAAMIALEQRVSQTAAALFAAAAFSATFALSFSESSAAFSVLGGLATMAFIVGALVCAIGVEAGDIVFPGQSPSWWKTCEFLKSRSSVQANYWLAGQLELAIASYDYVSRRRASYLNLAIRYAMAGGFLIAIAGFLAIFSR